MIRFKIKHKNIIMVDTSLLVVSVFVIILLLSFTICCISLCYKIGTRNEIVVGINQGNFIVIERDIEFNYDYTLDTIPKPYDIVQNEDPEKICSICLEEIGETECKLKCGHGFHFNCIREWAYVKRKNNCPECRGVIVEVEV